MTGKLGSFCVSLCEVNQSLPTLCNPMDCSLPGSSVHGIFQARILEWVAISFSRGSSQSSDWTWVSCIVGRHFTIWTTREVPIKNNQHLLRARIEPVEHQISLVASGSELPKNCIGVWSLDLLKYHRSWFDVLTDCLYYNYSSEWERWDSDSESANF